MIEKPIERLNFVNGERLKAADLKLEQEYHIRVQRWLNKSLYSAGIAHGLEVKAEPGRKDDKGRLVILVSPGLALDIDGREMILVEEAEVPIMGKPNKVGEPVQGNYLYIQYHEEKRSEESENCAPRGNGKSQLAWGGPTRVRATPVLGWSDYFPHESSGKVVLAQVELDDKDCSVRFVHTYPRRYIGPASNAMVRQYALEGERHIDKNNPGRIYFHIRGRQPTAVTLYLRAEQFSTLFYTELGNHNHSSSGQNASQTEAATSIDPHSHASTGLVTGTINAAGVREDEGKHSHTVEAYNSTFAQAPGDQPHPFMLQLITRLGGVVEDLFAKVGLIVQTTNSAHAHSIIGKTGDVLYLPSGTTVPPTPSSFHKHGLGADSVNPTGVIDVNARTGTTEKAFTFVDALQVYIGKAGFEGTHPVPGPDDKFTEEILAQLKSAQPAIYGTRLKLGEGRIADNPLYEHGTGPIRLDLLSQKLSFPEGEYYIDLAVTSGGGRIVYNLYVE